MHQNIKYVKTINPLKISTADIKMALLANLEKQIYVDQCAKNKEFFASLPVDKNCAKFFVNRMGFTGSTWLGKLLNSHPDVMCYHEGVMQHAFPSRGYGESDILNYLRFIASFSDHGAYKAVGDVGSTWIGHVLDVPPELFNAVTLIRHPIPMLARRLRMIRRGEGTVTGINLDLLIDIFKLNPIEFSQEDLIFLNDLIHWIMTIVFIDSSKIIHFEDLLDIGNAKSVCKRLTGLDFDDSLVLRAIDTRVNVSNEAKLDNLEQFNTTFSDLQKIWYLELLAPFAIQVGYENF